MKSSQRLFLMILALMLCVDLVSYSQNKVKLNLLIDALNSKELPLDSLVNLLLDVSLHHTDSKQAIDFAKQALSISQDLEDKKSQAQAYEIIGIHERLLGNNLKSTQASLEVIRIADEIKDDKLKASALAQLGANSISDENYVQAVLYFQESIQLYESLENWVLMAPTVLNMGEAFRLNNQLDSAALYFNQALGLNNSIKDPIITAYALGNLGMTYNAMGRLEEARSALDSALVLVDQLGDPYTESVYMADLALVNQKEGNRVEAIEGFEEALAIAEANGLKEQIRDISELLVNLYEADAVYDKAFHYQRLYQVYQDSLVDKANVQKIERLKASHEINKKEAEIDHLNTINSQRAREVIALAVVVFIVMGLLFLLIRSNRQIIKANHVLSEQKKMISQREEEKALLLKELNHRVKNNLQMVSSLLNLQGHQLKGHPAEAAIAAGKYRVDALALIHQKLYRDDLHTKVSLTEYIDDLVSNLCYSFGDKVTPKIDIDDLSISIDQAIPLALIINELVTNALKYAFEGISSPSLTVSAHKDDQNLVLKIVDNGIGFVPEEVVEGHSFGIKLVKSLVSQLSAEMSVSQSSGSHWEISIPSEHL